MNVNREVDSHIPGHRWEFNEDVARQFDLMLEKSIPGYGQMRELVFRLTSSILELAVEKPRPALSMSSRALSFSLVKSLNPCWLKCKRDSLIA